MSDVLTYDPTSRTDALTAQVMASLKLKSQPADYQTVEHYRKQMRDLMGNTMLPAVIMRGVLHAARRL